ncbi:hypothetical protein HY213_00445 [Candidatus Peregrinibacteria bacterium]|nr:hypothetical protein [Candidatus Peregrinibacteria bacterium]
MRVGETKPSKVPLNEIVEDQQLCHRFDIIPDFLKEYSGLTVRQIRDALDGTKITPCGAIHEDPDHPKHIGLGTGVYCPLGKNNLVCLHAADHKYDGCFRIISNVIEALRLFGRDEAVSQAYGIMEKVDGLRRYDDRVAIGFERIGTINPEKSPVPSFTKLHKKGKLHVLHERVEEEQLSKGGEIEILKKKLIASLDQLIDSLDHTASEQ